MKKILLLFFCIAMYSQSFAQLSRTINVTPESSLSVQLGTDASEVTDLVVKGTLSSVDIVFISDVRKNMPKLSTFDLGSAIFPSKVFAGMQPTTNFMNVVPTTSVTSIVLPNDIEELAMLAFNKFTNLKSIKLPSSLKIIGNYCFTACEKLNNVILPESLELLASGVFAGCSSLESISIPAKIDKTSYQLFQGCSKLHSVTFPEGIKIIGNSSFTNCRSLSSLVIPNSVTTIEYAAFLGCYGLTNISLPKNPLFVTLNSYTFYSCSDLQQIRIPSSVKSIDQNVFADCTNLQTVICDAEVPPTFLAENSWNSFNIANCKLIVPASSVDAYKSAEVWKTFGTTVATGINKTTINDLRISSENNILNVISNTQLKSIEVFNSNGMLIGSQMDSNTASFVHLPKGLIVVKVISADGRVDVSKQIIK